MISPWFFLWHYPDFPLFWPVLGGLFVILTLAWSWQRL